jgi:hypothetical protein
MRAIDEVFEMSHDPPAEEVPNEAMPGWWWKEQKKKKRAREEAQHDLELGIQLNMFENTVAGARNVPAKPRPPRVSESYGEGMEGASGEKRRGKGTSGKDTASFGLRGNDGRGKQTGSRTRSEVTGTDESPE